MEHRSTDERRAQIVSALLQVMAEHGYEKATIARIANAAEITPGLVHYHFRSKQKILLALLDTLVDEEIARLEPDDDVPPHDRLRAIVDRLLATGGEARPEAVAAWVTISAEAIRQPEVRDRFHAALRSLADILTAVIDAGTRDGTWQPVHPTAEIVGAVLAIVQGYYSLAATARDLVPHSSAAPAALALLDSLLQTELS